VSVVVEVLDDVDVDVLEDELVLVDVEVDEDVDVDVEVDELDVLEVDDDVLVEDDVLVVVVDGQAGPSRQIESRMEPARVATVRPAGMTSVGTLPLNVTV
jgi:hypothetical protein